jgi:hypothetical protein
MACAESESGLADMVTFLAFLSDKRAAGVRMLLQSTLFLKLMIALLRLHPCAFWGQPKAHWQQLHRIAARSPVLASPVNFI